MPESFLYFLWQFRYFQTLSLTTTDGEPVQILHPGHRNAHAGPDFTNARLLIGGVEWFGTVEAHTRTSDWLAHRHQHDRAYDNVILHIVWQDDRPADRRLRQRDGSPLPTLVLEPVTDPALIGRYGALADAPQPIACAGSWRTVSPLRVTAMLDAVLLQRLQRKADAVMTTFAEANQDWEETAWRLLAVSLGANVNADPMAQLARTLPLKMLWKHRDNLLQIEAILFGTAGLLPPEPTPDEAERGPADYVTNLRREYRFLRTKYGLADRELLPHVWKWARLRPAGFPTLRLAQLAQLVVNQDSLFGLLVQTERAEVLQRALQVTPSAHWQQHYRFGEPAKGKVAATLGRATADGVLINTAVPLLAAYAHHRDRPAFLDRAVALLEQLPPEDNTIARQWAGVGLSVRSAFDSQAGIELYKLFCEPKRCLSCQIGTALVRPDKKWPEG